MILELHRFNNAIIRRGPGEHQTDAGEAIAIIIVKLITMTMALVNHRLSIALLQQRTGHHLARIATKAHCAALVDGRILIRHKVDHLMRAVLVKLTGIRSKKSGNVARELDHRNLHTKAKTKVGNFVFARIFRGLNHTLYPAHAKATWEYNAIQPCEFFGYVLRVNGF